MAISAPSPPSTNLSALAPLTTTALTLSNLILVSPQKTVGYQPQNPPSADGTDSKAQQPPALLFNYEGEQTATIESDITDHYIEDNTAIQDQISLMPEVITTSGFIGELNDVVPLGLQTAKIAADKLTVIDGYIPGLSTSALLQYNTAFQLYQTGQQAINASVATWSSINGTNDINEINSSGLKNPISKIQTKQQIAFQQFYGYWRQRTLFTVQTPWAVFKNMAIKSLRAIQDAETKEISNFEITFKTIRTATTILENKLVQNRLQTQSGGIQDNGVTTGVPSISLDAALDGMES